MVLGLTYRCPAISWLVDVAQMHHITEKSMRATIRISAVCGMMKNYMFEKSTSAQRKYVCWIEYLFAWNDLLYGMVIFYDNVRPNSLPILSCCDFALPQLCPRSSFCSCCSRPLHFRQALWLVMAMVAASSPKPRLKCDPDLGYAQHLQIVKEFLETRKTRDLMKCLEMAADLKWTHAVKLRHIVPYHDLFVIVAKHCAGAMKLNHKFLVNAALEIHHSPDGAILFGPSSIGCELIAATSSFRIRCLVSKFRLLGSDAAIYARLRNEVPTWLQKYISVLQKHKKMHNFSGAGGCVCLRSVAGFSGGSRHFATSLDYVAQWFFWLVSCCFFWRAYPRCPCGCEEGLGAAILNLATKIYLENIKSQNSFSI